MKLFPPTFTPFAPRHLRLGATLALALALGAAAAGGGCTDLAAARRRNAANERPPEVATVRQGVGGTILPSIGLESVRYGENIKAYPVSRYVDPNDRGVMHEGHIIYRAETTAKWNLHPNLPVVVPLGPTLAVNNPARRTSVLPAELEGELANQRANSTELAAQNARLTETIARLQGLMDNADRKLQETTDVKAQLQRTQQELEAVRQEMRKQRVTPPPAATPPPKEEKKNRFGF